MTNYKMIQLTNTNVGAVAENDIIPLGVVTRKICTSSTPPSTFEVTTSDIDTVTLNEKGYYKITFNASIQGDSLINVNLLLNNGIVYTISQTLTTGTTSNITLDYVVRVFGNCTSCPTNNPANIQIQVTGAAITAGTSNLIIEKVY